MRCLLTAALLSAFTLPAFAQRLLTASPFRPGPDGYGSVTLAWSAPPGTPVEIHVGSPSGDLVSAARSSGSFDTGPWVTDGTRFFLQQPINSGFDVTLASLTIHPGPTLPLRHYIVVLAGGGTNPSYPVTPAVLIFDRDTLDQLTRVALPAVPSSAVAAGLTLYIPVVGDNPGVVLFDLGALGIRGLIPLPVNGARPVFATGAGGVARILVPTTTAGVALLDPATGSPAGSIACPGLPAGLVCNPANQTTYGYGGSFLCVITPQFQAGPPIPLSRIANQAILLPNDSAGVLLLTTFNDVDTPVLTTSLDLSTLAISPLPALDNVRPAVVVSRASTFLYGAVASSSPQPPVQRFQVTFPAGAPVFTPQFPYPPPSVAAPFLYDGRYLYTNILGYCSTLEGGVFGCSGGFTLLDLALQPVASVVLGSASASAPDIVTSVQNFGVAAAGTLPLPAPQPRLH